MLRKALKKETYILRKVLLLKRNCKQIFCTKDNKFCLVLIYVHFYSHICLIFKMTTCKCKENQQIMLVRTNLVCQNIMEEQHITIYQNFMPFLSVLCKIFPFTLLIRISKLLFEHIIKKNGLKAVLLLVKIRKSSMCERKTCK